VAGLGNAKTDTKAYLAAGVHPLCVALIDERSAIRFPAKAGHRQLRASAAPPGAGEEPEAAAVAAVAAEEAAAAEGAKEKGGGGDAAAFKGYTDAGFIAAISEVRDSVHMPQHFGARASGAGACGARGGSGTLQRLQRLLRLRLRCAHAPHTLPPTMLGMLTCPLDGLRALRFVLRAPRDVRAARAGTRRCSRWSGRGRRWGSYGSCARPTACPRRATGRCSQTGCAQASG
jgi:hypothetical protein